MRRSCPRRGSTVSCDPVGMGTYVVTGSASGIGATSVSLLVAGHTVIGVDQHRADVVADLATDEGRQITLDEVGAATRRAVWTASWWAPASVRHERPLERILAVNVFGALAIVDGLHGPRSLRAVVRRS